MLPTLKTEKSTLRPFRMSDAESVALHANDEAVARNLSKLPHPYTLKDAKQWLRIKTKQYKQKNPTGLVSAIEIDGEAVDSIGIHEIIKGHKAEMGYWLGRKYWGGGIMSEVVAQVAKYGFGKLKLRRIYAKVFLFNKISARVLEKNGFKYEGVLKKDTKKGNKFIDVRLFAKVR